MGCSLVFDAFKAGFSPWLFGVYLHKLELWGLGTTSSLSPCRSSSPFSLESEFCFERVLVFGVGYRSLRAWGNEP